MPCQQTLLLLAGGLNLGSCPYRILREILRKLAWDLGCCVLLGAAALQNAEQLPL